MPYNFKEINYGLAAPNIRLEHEACKNKTDARKRELELKNRGYSKEQLSKRL